MGLFFLAIPVVGGLYGGWQAYQQDGRLTGRVISRLIWAIFPFIFVLPWYLGINIANLWPLMLILIGITMLLNQRSE